MGDGDGHTVHGHGGERQGLQKLEGECENVKNMSYYGMRHSTPIVQRLHCGWI